MDDVIMQHSWDLPGQEAEGGGEGFSSSDLEKIEVECEALLSETDRIAAENRELRERLSAPERQAEIENEDAETFRFAEEKYGEALDAIDELDPDDPEYRNKVARVWAKTDKEIRRTRDPGRLQPRSANDSRPMEEAYSLFKQALDAEGIDIKDPTFIQVARQAPEVGVNGERLPLEEQIKWVVNSAKKARDKKSAESGPMEEIQTVSLEEALEAAAVRL